MRLLLMGSCLFCFLAGSAFAQENTDDSDGPGTVVVPAPPATYGGQQTSPQPAPGTVIVESDTPPVGRPLAPAVGEQYRTETVYRTGLIISGSIMFGIPWLIGLSLELGEEDWEDDTVKVDGLIAIPILGAFLEAGRADNSLTTAVWTLSGLLQAAGITMLTFGLIGREEQVYVGPGQIYVNVSPWVTPNSAGVALTMLR